MKPISHELEKGRVVRGMFASKREDGNNGHFIFKYHQKYLYCVVSSGMDWEHVSVRVTNAKISKEYIPDYRALKTVKELFWNDDECVVQYFPPKTDHININPKVLHLWRPLKAEIPMPPKGFV